MCPRFFLLYTVRGRCILLSFAAEHKYVFSPSRKYRYLSLFSLTTLPRLFLMLLGLRGHSPTSLPLMYGDARRHSHSHSHRHAQAKRGEGGMHEWAARGGLLRHTNSTKNVKYICALTFCNYVSGLCTFTKSTKPVLFITYFKLSIHIGQFWKNPASACDVSSTSASPLLTLFSQHVKSRLMHASRPPPPLSHTCIYMSHTSKKQNAKPPKSEPRYQHRKLSFPLINAPQIFVPIVVSRGEKCARVWPLSSQQRERKIRYRDWSGDMGGWVCGEEREQGRKECEITF